MAASSLLALIDDIATLLDDVALMTKVAAKNTAGVLGDDLALNAQQVSGVNADRELPVVMAVAKGSLKNKLILVPAALSISALIPWAVTPLLMAGGAYLCFEGFEKLAHKFMHGKLAERAGHDIAVQILNHPEINLVALEKEKIQGAIRTDFILSAEIIVIALGSVRDAAFLNQVIVVSGIALIMTAGVYGIVAGIVKLDDLGLYLVNKGKGWLKPLGNIIVSLAPKLMKTLSVVGTAAMFLVGGGILLHGLPHAHELLLLAASAARSVPVGGPLLAPLAPVLLSISCGLAAGAFLLGATSIANRVTARFKKGT